MAALCSKRVLHLEGAWDIVRPETVVLSSRDYTEHIFGNLPFMQFVQRALLSRTFLFVGSSLNDTYVRRVLEETRYLTGGVGMPHYALMQNPGPIKSKQLRDRFNITPIAYDPSEWPSPQAAVVEIVKQITASVQGAA